jgi:immune inhibitor A
MFTEGAVIADQQYNIDFSQYDFDNNGEVDNLYGFFAGYDQAQGGPEECVWSHASSIAWRNIVLDGTKIGGYACSS